MNSKISKKLETLLLKNIRDIHDFPKKGIIFKDITTLLGNSEVFSALLDHLEARYKTFDLDYIAGIDARGFIFGAILADRLKVGFVPIRKKGKLPSETFRQKYSLEYGYNEVEIHKDAFNKKNARVLLIDDLIATGGSAKATQALVKKAGGFCVESCFIIELKDLKGSNNLDGKVYSILKI